MKISMVLISSNEDAVLCVEPFCDKCFIAKIHGTPLKKWNTSIEDVNRWTKKPYNIRLVRINCVCPKKKNN